VKVMFQFRVGTAPEIKSTRKLDLAACFRHAKCSFRVRLHKKIFRNKLLKDHIQTVI
jgi:hypothetical protein